MRQHLFRKLAAAVVAATALATTAIAQAPKTGDVPPVIKPVPNVMPAPAPPAAMPPVTIVPVVPAVPTHVVAVAPPAADCGTPACKTGCASDCGPTEKKSVFGRLVSKHAIGVGTATPVGCGCHAAEKTFVFGSCSQFFNPGRTCGDIGKGCGGRGNPCPGIHYAHPYGKPGTNCAGPFTYLDR